MKRILLGAAVLAVLLALYCGIARFWSAHVALREEQECINNMGILESAAVSPCLEYRLNAKTMITMENLLPFLRPGQTNCPAGGEPYASFSVLYGPVCPNGHKFEPDISRPFRAPSANRKLGGLYIASGLTNLIDP